MDLLNICGLKKPLFSSAPVSRISPKEQLTRFYYVSKFGTGRAARRHYCTSLCLETAQTSVASRIQKRNVQTVGCFFPSPAYLRRSLYRTCDRLQLRVLFTGARCTCKPRILSIHVLSVECQTSHDCQYHSFRTNVSLSNNKSLCLSSIYKGGWKD